MLFLTGDISGGEWARAEFGRGPGRTRPYYRLDLADLARGERPDPAADPARGAGPALHHRPGRGAVHGAAVAQAAGPVHARARREPRAHAARRALPPGREPGPGPRLVRPLPRQGRDEAAAGDAEPRRGADDAARGRDALPAGRGVAPRVRPAGGRAVPDVLREAVDFDAELPRAAARRAARAGRPLPRRDAGRDAMAGGRDRRRGRGRRAWTRSRSSPRPSRRSGPSVRRRRRTALVVDGRCTDLVARRPPPPTGTYGSPTPTTSRPPRRRPSSRSSGACPASRSCSRVGIGPWISVGWNSAGLSLTGNELSPNDERVGVPRLLMVREQLTARTLDEAVAMALRPDRASSYNTVFAHRDGGVRERRGLRRRRRGDGPSAAGTLAHTNHYACERMRGYEGDPAYARRSAVRLGRALDLLDGEDGAGPAPGSITPERLLRVPRRPRDVAVDLPARRRRRRPRSRSSGASRT